MSQVPSAAASAGGEPGNRAAGRRRGTVLAVLASGLAGVVVGSSTWATAGTTSALGVETVLDVSGRAVAPGVVAGGLVVAAAALALALAGRVAGRVAALAVVAAGALEAWSAVEGVQGVGRAAAAVARQEVGVDVLTTAPATTIGPWVAVGVGVLTVVVGAVAFVRTPRWAAARLAADARPGPAATSGHADDASRQDADRRDADGRVRDGRGADDGLTDGGAADGGDDVGGDLDGHDAWDALSRGEDPS